MERRELLAGAGLFGFTLAVDARDMLSPSPAPAPEGDAESDVRPDPLQPRRVGEEFHMRRVDMPVDPSGEAGPKSW